MLRYVLLVLSSLMLAACIANVWTGASLLYNRHNVYKKMGDYQLAAKIQHLVRENINLRCSTCLVDVTVFNKDVLLAGHLPSANLRESLANKVKQIGGYDDFYNQLSAHSVPATPVEDSWITAKVRGRIFANAAINPGEFKIITVDRIVYLMGNVEPSQAKEVIKIARTTTGVRRVVTLIKYYRFSEKTSA